MGVGGWKFDVQRLDGRGLFGSKLQHVNITHSYVMVKGKGGNVQARYQSAELCCKDSSRDDDDDDDICFDFTCEMQVADRQILFPFPVHVYTGF